MKPAKREKNISEIQPEALELQPVTDKPWANQGVGEFRLELSSAKPAKNRSAISKRSSLQSFTCH